ncbi:MAG: hypothetical protein NDP22_02735 [Crenarchaeota archaeon]|nr:hypothetical protein [Thermoproteota archaeon]
MSQQVENIGKALEELRTSYEISLKNMTENTNRNISELNETVISSTKASIAGVVSTISRNIEEESRKISDRINKAFSEAIFKETRKALVGFEESLTTMLKLYEETVRRLVPEKRTLWLVRGISGVTAHIKEMIRRANSFVILVLPSLDQVPMDRIAELKGLVRVQIAARVNLSSSSHMRILNILKARRGVHVRNYGEANIIGCTIDGKEAIFAVVSPSGDIYGIGTSDEGWVNMIQGFLTYVWTTATEVH